MRTVYSPHYLPTLARNGALPPRHNDPLLLFYHLLAAIEVFHRLRVVPASSLPEHFLTYYGPEFVGKAMQELKRTPFAILDEPPPDELRPKRN